MEIELMGWIGEDMNDEEVIYIDELEAEEEACIELLDKKEKNDGDNGMDRVASIIHTFHYYLVVMDNNVKKDLTVTLVNMRYYYLSD